MPVVTHNRIDLIILPYGGGADDSDLTGQLAVASSVVWIEFSAQLLFVDSPLPTFFCFISCCVFVSDSSPAVAYADVENIPVNTAAVKTAAIAIVLFIISSSLQTLNISGMLHIGV
jgi:hypothetical protein